MEPEIPGHSDARRNETPDDDVALKADMVVLLAATRSLGEHARGLLEGSRREEAVGRERRLGNPEEHPVRSDLRAFRLANPRVLILERELVHHLSGQERAVAGMADAPLLQHLAHDHL